jgi:hypothetical protein
MKLLVCLKVRYGFPVNALYGFLKKKDHETWGNYLRELSFDICVNHAEGCIYLLMKNCGDLLRTKQELSSLPLVKEEFVDINILEFVGFTSLDTFFAMDTFESACLT